MYNFTVFKYYQFSNIMIKISQGFYYDLHKEIKNMTYKYDLMQHSLKK